MNAPPPTSGEARTCDACGRLVDTRDLRYLLEVWLAVVLELDGIPINGLSDYGFPPCECGVRLAGKSVALPPLTKFIFQIHYVLHPSKYVVRFDGKGVALPILAKEAQRAVQASVSHVPR